MNGLTLHVGHHFFGAGNLGDDFMLAGFLSALPAGREIRLTCCVPHPRGPLARRFPQVQWLPYDPAARLAAIQGCDVWLGLGGSPFQNAVSSWFVDHLAQELQLCREHAKPMFFLGVGGQDAAAFSVPQSRAVLERAEMIWTRDADTAARAAEAGGQGRVRVAADLAHLFFAAHPPPPAEPGRLTAVLNFDFATWSRVAGAVQTLAALPARERVWLAQESRPLPAAEIDLFQKLAPAEQVRWRLVRPDEGDRSLAEALARWPSGEWLIASRYHASLAGAWAGSKGVVVAINEKLVGASKECGWPAFAVTDSPGDLPRLLAEARPVDRSVLARLAERAGSACAEFFAAVA